MSTPVRRLAMWAGPRNIATAMMRSWGNRPDTFVWDEPFYAFYLLKTAAVHPGADEIIRYHETSWKRVVERLLGAPPPGATIYYQKHLTHHMLPEIDRSFLPQLDNVFLIREPREVLLSLLRYIPRPRLEDTGLLPQLEIFEMVRRQSGRIPPVLDARDILDNPEGILRRLCEELNYPFAPEMLSWAPGPRATDGIWGKHWYCQVWEKTGFERYKPRPEALPDSLKALLARADELYQQLHAHRLTAQPVASA